MISRIKVVVLCAFLAGGVLLGGCEFEADVDEPDSRLHRQGDNLAWIASENTLS